MYCCSFCPCWPCCCCCPRCCCCWCLVSSLPVPAPPRKSDRTENRDTGNVKKDIDMAGRTRRASPHKGLGHRASLSGGKPEPGCLMGMPSSCSSWAAHGQYRVLQRGSGERRPLETASRTDVLVRSRIVPSRVGLILSGKIAMPLGAAVLPQSTVVRLRARPRSFPRYAGLAGPTRQTRTQRRQRREASRGVSHHSCLWISCF